MSMNRVVIVGRMVRDADLRYTGNSGVAVANFTVAANRPFKNQEGENEADFINVVCWRKLAENTANYTKKGSLVGVDGRLQSRTYKDKDDKTIFVTEIVAESVQFLDTKNSSNSNNSEKPNSSNQQTNQSTNNYNSNQTNQNNVNESEGAPIDISDDELPF